MVEFAAVSSSGLGFGGDVCEVVELALSGPGFSVDVAEEVECNSSSDPGFGGGVGLDILVGVR